MKNFLKYTAVACLGAFTLSSCSDDDDIVKLNPSEFVAPVITSSNATLVLDENNQEAIVYTFEWEKAIYGINTNPKYDVEIVQHGENFENATVLTTTNETSFSINTKDLNNAVIDLGLEPNIPSEVDYRIVAYLGTSHSSKIISEVRTLTITPFATDLSTPWGLVGDATPNGWNGPDVPFWKSGTANVFVAYAKLEGGKYIKIRKDNDWAENYGGTGGVLSAGGSDILIAQTGYYKVTFDYGQLTYTIEPYKLGIVGSAVASGWSGPDTDVLSYDGTTDTWKVRVVFGDGEFKIRLNDDWAINYGLGNSAGTLTTDNGGNIAVSAGTYDLEVDFNRLTYTLTPVQ